MVGSLVMSPDGAQRAITTSAVIVGMVYAYRRLFEGSAQTGAHIATGNSVKQLVGIGPPPPLGHWIVGYGFAFLLISWMAEVDPGLGGGFAILMAVGTLLTQGQQMLADVTKQLDAGSAGSSSGVTTSQAYGIGAAALGTAASQAFNAGNDPRISGSKAVTGSTSAGSPSGVTGGTGPQAGTNFGGFRP